jgi:MraZ protein
MRRKAGIAVMLTWPFVLLAGLWAAPMLFRSPQVLTRVSEPAALIAGTDEPAASEEPLRITSVPFLADEPPPERTAPLPPAPPTALTVVFPQPVVQPLPPPAPEPLPQPAEVTAAPSVLSPSVSPPHTPAVRVGRAEQTVAVEALPPVRQAAVPVRAARLPLTGAFPSRLDDRLQLALPAALRTQLDPDGVLLIAPGPTTCLWLTTPEHVDRLIERLERAGQVDVQAFRRLFFAQAEKVAVEKDGSVVLPDRLARWAGLNGEVMLAGADEHIEIWDMTHWEQTKRAADER